jgi:hypothetical protein
MSRLESGFDFEGQFHEVLDSIRSLDNALITVEDTLFHSELWGPTRYKLVNAWPKKGIQGANIGEFLDRVTEVDYLDLGNKMNYYVENGKVFICSPLTAKIKLCSWWSGLSNDNIKEFENDKPIYR